MKQVFSPVNHDDVVAACRETLVSGAPANRTSKSTFVIFEGHQLPAKYVLGRAYEIATGRTLAPEDYTGGEATARILQNLGFQVIVGGRARRASADSFVIATACVAGTIARTPAENRGRISLLNAMVAGIQLRRWQPMSLLLPGGFFRLPTHIGTRSHAERVECLRKQGFSKACRVAAGELSSTVIAGVDSPWWRRPGYDYADAGDQLCVAWSKSAIVGLGRKVYPTAGEAEDLVIYAKDIGSSHRLARLDTDRQALLCACYDMFGCNEMTGSPGRRSKNIRWLATSSDELLERRTHRAHVDSAIADGLGGWEALVRGASVGCVAIHGFTRTGPGSGKAYWQRHGIEKASLHIGGRMAFGAAHLEAPLPKPTVATFAAKNGQALMPSEHFVVSTRNGLEALVRLYRV